MRLSPAVRVLLGTITLFTTTLLCAQQPAAQPPSQQGAPERDEQAMHQFQATQKSIDDLLWYMKLSDVAQVDRFELTSTKPIRMSNPTGQGAGNPLIIYAYTFVPKKLGNRKAPLLVFVHGACIPTSAPTTPTSCAS